jgi:TonB family protein
MSETPAPARRNRGLFIVIFLGVIFFTLLALLILVTGRKSSAPATQSETLTVLPQKLRVRTEPSAKAPVVTTVNSGDQLSMVEDHGEWVRVQTVDGLSGWTERSSLERTAERERRLARYTAIRKLPPLTGVATNRTPLYAGPGIFYPVVGELPERTDVKVYTRDHDFYAIDRGNEVAYADIDSIDVSASGAPQLNVSTSTVPSAPTETTASAGTPPVANDTLAPPPEPAPAERIPQEREADRSVDDRVFSVVPPGGTQPEEVERVVPRYPAEARRSRIGGAVVIRGIVRRDGTIDDVQILKDLPYGLGDAALDAVRRWKFRPATYHGDPIDVYYTVTVNFRLQ